MMTSTTMRIYQQFTRTTAVYPTTEALPYLVTALASEAGEVAGKYSKYIRGDYKNRHEFADALVDEMGDVLWTLARLADEFGYSLEELATFNRDKLIDRQNRQVLKGSGDKR